MLCCNVYVRDMAVKYGIQVVYEGVARYLEYYLVHFIAFIASRFLYSIHYLNLSEECSNSKQIASLRLVRKNQQFKSNCIIHETNLTGKSSVVANSTRPTLMSQHELIEYDRIWNGIPTSLHLWKEWVMYGTKWLHNNYYEYIHEICSFEYNGYNIVNAAQVM